MRLLSLRPILHSYENCREFVEAFMLGEDDLILTNKFIYEPYFDALGIGAEVVFQENYGAGEPSDAMADAIFADIKGNHKRVIAIGGGTVIDLAKIFALKNVSPVLSLFDRKLDIVKDKELVLVPTTCGTGSEVTNISILELKSRRIKMGLAADELYADSAVMIPQLLEKLPFRFFAASSIDALIHAIESAVSPKATPYTRLFSFKAIDMIVRGYRDIAAKGETARIPLLGDFLIASNYAGIAFGNAGVGAVHALSYPLGGKYHVPHGEANYALFGKVFETYAAKRSGGALDELSRALGEALSCSPAIALPALSGLLDTIMARKPLRDYGVTERDIADFTDNVMTKQGRLMANNFVELGRDDVEGIYRALY